MTSPAKTKGDNAERELAALIALQTGWPARRKLGAGRLDDAGDIDGIPQTTCQVKSYKDVSRAISDALADLEQQRLNAGTPFAFAAIRRPGGRWMAVMDLDHVLTMIREATT